MTKLRFARAKFKASGGGSGGRGCGLSNRELKRLPNNLVRSLGGNGWGFSAREFRLPKSRNLDSFGGKGCGFSARDFRLSNKLIPGFLWNPSIVRRVASRNFGSAVSDKGCGSQPPSRKERRQNNVRTSYVGRIRKQAV